MTLETYVGHKAVNFLGALNFLETLFSSIFPPFNILTIQLTTNTFLNIKWKLKQGAKTDLKCHRCYSAPFTIAQCGKKYNLEALFTNLGW